MNYIDTIVALATPQGKGGIGIIRISGAHVPKISYKLFHTLTHPRQATYLPIYDIKEHTKILDTVISIFFPKPNSFTGEDILEIHGHGGPIILEIIIQNILDILPNNIRLARPGEFSERAFMNNKIDLVQAEAISDLINAHSQQAAKSASNTLQGALSKKINTINKQLSQLRVYIESYIDFSEEKIPILSSHIIQKKIKNIINNTKQTYQSVQQGCLIQNGTKIVLTGKPNAGKSSLFNSLAGKESAIITNIEGTTRDILYEYIELNGLPFTITDTAGLQINNKTSNILNEIEKISIERAWHEMKTANHILLIIDINTTNNQEYNQLFKHIIKKLPKTHNIPITIIRNKADLTNNKIQITHTNDNYTMITISIKLNQGIDLIKQHLINTHYTFDKTDEEGYFTARQRHAESLKKSYTHLLNAYHILIKQNFHTQKPKHNPTQIEINELMAEELKYAQIELNTITGKYHSEKLLQKIFSTFCIGK